MNNKHSKFTVLLQKLARYSGAQKWFVLYLVVLWALLLLFPIVSIQDIDWQWGQSFWLLGSTFAKSALIVFIALIIMLWWNVSFKVKNLMIKYFDFKSDDVKINFVCLWFILAVFFSITDTIDASFVISPRMGMTFWGWTIQVILIVWFIFNLYLLIKQAKQIGKRTKIVNIHSDEGKKEDTTSDSKLKGLFGENK